VALLWIHSAGAYFLVGIAAGLRDQVNLGDVVIPVQATYFESGTQRTNLFEPAPDPRLVPEPLSLNLNYYDPDGTAFYERLAGALANVPEGNRPPRYAEYRPWFPDKVVIACDDKVRRDASLKILNERHDRRIKAADMESYGFAEALAQNQWAVFRGISDHGEEDKDDDWQMYAAVAACIALRDFLETEFEPPDVPRY
jgi:nucleoside phosphorylase